MPSNVAALVAVASPAIVRLSVVTLANLADPLASIEAVSTPFTCCIRNSFPKPEISEDSLHTRLDEEISPPTARLPFTCRFPWVSITIAPAIKYKG